MKMHIELIGCTGAGKSTLLEGMLKACKAEGVRASSGEEYLLRKAGLSGLRGSMLRTLVIDLMAIPYSLLIWNRHREYMQLVSRLIAALPASVPWLQKLNLRRNILKQTGLYAIARGGLRSGEMVIMDEGTLHAAHYLFVHANATLPDTELERFASVAPLPDAVILVSEDERVLVERTLKRGHKRIPAGEPELVERFIQRAMHTFDVLTREPKIRSRLWMVNSREGTIEPANNEMATSEPELLKILEESLRGTSAPQRARLETPEIIETEIMVHDD